MEHENILTVNNRLLCPGITLDRPLPVRETMSMAGLLFDVEERPVYQVISGVIQEIPGHKAVVRTDTNASLGIVGQAYKPLETERLIRFLELFTEKSGTYIESAGFVRNGAMIWLMASVGTVEFLPNDPSRQFFLIRNTHDGSSHLEVGFTSRRIVCNNMLPSLDKDSVSYGIRHTQRMECHVSNIERVISAQYRQLDQFGQIMDRLCRRRLNLSQLKELSYRLIKAEAPGAPEVIEAEFEVKEPPAVSKIMELAESGQGTDIPGVRGSAYGWLNAVTEYVDHHRKSRTLKGRDADETKFESVIFGAGARLKNQAVRLALAA
jgi:phage/plasmid-like protein (TIGR03299 family)